jgi:ribosomal protein L32E
MIDLISTQALRQAGYTPAAATVYTHPNGDIAVAFDNRGDLVFLKPTEKQNET